jgi:hypothetical protein
MVLKAPEVGGVRPTLGLFPTQMFCCDGTFKFGMKTILIPPTICRSLSKFNVSYSTLKSSIGGICWPCPPRQEGYCVFRFIREYSSLRDFYRPLGNNNNRSIYFYMRVFER